MPFYHSLGTIPRKRHMVFRQPDGKLYSEELTGNKGFTGPASLLYHIHPPTAVLARKQLGSARLTAEPRRVFGHRHFETGVITNSGGVAVDRIPILFNGDVAMSIAQPKQPDDFFYRNAQADEVV